MPKRKRLIKLALDTGSNEKLPVSRVSPIKSEPFEPSKTPKLFNILFQAHIHDMKFEISEAENLWRRAANRARKQKIVQNQNGGCIEAEYMMNGSQLPLHLAIEQAAPYHVIRAMVDVYPKGCEVPFDVSPLHLACTYPRKKLKEDIGEEPPILEDYPDSEKVIRLLMKKHPKAIGVDGGNSTRTTALHCVLENKPSKGLVKKMIKRHKSYVDEVNSLGDGTESLLRIKDGQDQLPLHVAVENNASSKVILFLHRAYSRATKVPRRHHDGCLVLHCAVLFGCSEEVLIEIMESFPDGLAHQNNRGETPLHLLFSSENETRWAESKSRRIEKKKQVTEMEICMLLLRLYTKYQTDKFTKVRNLFRKLDQWGLTIVKAAKKCAQKNPVPNDLINFLEAEEMGKSTNGKQGVLL